MDLKPSNPKDKIGVRKVSPSRLSQRVIMAMSLGLLEGDRKYGGHNYRVAGVLASVYYDATMRHLMQWWEGEDIDKDSGLPHIVKAMSSMAILVDAYYNNKMTDDRPPKLEEGWVTEFNTLASAIIDKYPDRIEPYTELNKLTRKEN